MSLAIQCMVCCTLLCVAGNIKSKSWHHKNPSGASFPLSTCCHKPAAARCQGSHVAWEVCVAFKFIHKSTPHKSAVMVRCHSTQQIHVCVLTAQVYRQAVNSLYASNEVGFATCKGSDCRVISLVGWCSRPVEHPTSICYSSLFVEPRVFRPMAA